MTDPGIQQKALQLTAQAQAIVITDQATYAKAGEALLTLKAMLDEIDGVFDPIDAASWRAYKEGRKQRAALLDPILTVDVWLRGQMAGYLDQEAAQRVALQAAMTAQAEHQAEATQVEQAATLEAEGRHEEAEAVLEAPPISAPVFLSPPKAEGISWHMEHRAVVVNPLSLVKAVAAGMAPLAAIQPDLVWLNKQAKALKGLMNYPGVRVVEERVMVARER